MQVSYQQKYARSDGLCVAAVRSAAPHSIANRLCRTQLTGTTARSLHTAVPWFCFAASTTDLDGLPTCAGKCYSGLVERLLSRAIQDDYEEGLSFSFGCGG